MQKKELLKNTFIITIGKVSTQLVTFLMLPIYTKYLITSEYGYVDLIITYVSLLVPILTLQLEMASFRFLIDCRNDQNLRKKVISNNVIALIVFLIISCILLLLISLFVNIKYVYYIIGIVIVSMISGNLLQIARGIGDNITFSISSVITAIITIVLNIVLVVYCKLSIKGVFISLLIANSISILFLIFKLKIFRDIKVEYYDKNILKKMFYYSIPLIPNTISWWVMNVSDRTLITYFISLNKNGIYAVSSKFPSILSSIFSIFNLSWSESISLHINDKDKDEYISDVFNDVILIFGSIGILIISILSLIFKFIIDVDYYEAYLYIPILIYASIFNLLSAQYGAIYIAKKDTKKLSSSTILAAILNIIINVVLIKYIALYAACISTLISYLIITIYRHYDTKKYVKVKLNYTNILILFLISLIVVVIYYINNYFINIISFILSSILLVYLNKNIINSFIKMILKK